ncbi:MAG TPA: triose-phosphate isomerase [Candidatus Dormibacteraeota bacterium]|nr:triose-phosphate isomerase [Candidatus Dormibacteraeota bacterium]
MTLPLVAGNWKMNTTVSEGVALAAQLRDVLGTPQGVEVAVLPPFTHLWPLRDALAGSGIELGAQDVFWELSGAYTGEVSAAPLVEICQYALVGHSERRHVLGESDEAVGRKFACASAAGLHVIVAVGETDRERDDAETFAVVERQLDAAFAPLSPPPAADRYVIAYEPVWAIGTGRTATPDQAQEVCAHIKRHLEGRGVAVPRVLYGGSVSGANAASLFAEADIDGALVGGASLRAREFGEIVNAAAQVAAAS